MYIKFCINKIKLRDLEIHTAKYNDTYIYDKKYYVLYKIPFHFFFIAEIVLVLDQNFIETIYLSMKCTKCDYFSNTLKVSICIQTH